MEPQITIATFADLREPPLQHTDPDEVARLVDGFTKYGVLVPIDVSYDMTVINPNQYLALRKVRQKNLRTLDRILVRVGRHLSSTKE